ncbi:MAG: hypothetical protein AAFZ07_14960 [Actinomycetota bacterium]
MAQVIRSTPRGSSASIVEEREDGSIVVEADSAEEGVELARDRFGADAEILEVTRIERGGLRGFFARELFQVVAGPAAGGAIPSAAPRPAPAVGVRPEVDALVRQIGQVGRATPPPVADPAPATAPPAADAPAGIDRALGRVESEEEAFGSMLRRELHARGLATSPAETIDLTDGGSSAGAPVPVGPAAARPLRPGGAATPVPPVPVPPAEPFRIDGPPSTGPLPVTTPMSNERARSTLQEAVVVESQAQVRPPSTTREPTIEPIPVRPAPEARAATSAPAPAESATEGREALVAPPVESPDRAEQVEPEPTPVEATAPERRAVEVVEAEPEQEPAASAVEAEPEPEPTPLEVAEPLAPGLGAVRWSVDRLAHLGLPFALVQRTVGLDPADDQRWLLTLAAGLADFVRPEPAGSAVFAGPRADRIGAAMDLPVVEAPELPPYGGSVALKTIDDGAGRAWLGRVRGDRVLHVVVGGRGWELLLAKQPDAVVVSSTDAVLTGLQVAVEHGVPISYVADGGGLRRANALDLAISVRSLVGRW